MTDINSSNGSEEYAMGKVSTLTVSHSGYEASTESQAETNGGSISTRRGIDPISSFKIQNNGIDHDICVDLQQEGDDSEEEEAMKVKREEVEVR